MPGIDLSFTVPINASVHKVFEYCRDPRRIYAGDPMYKVVDATLTPEGVGTRAHLEAKVLVFTEDIAIEYVAFVPDQRIVFDAHPTMTIAGRQLGSEIFNWTWMFVPADGGTTLDVELVNRGGARWERALDALGAEKVISKQVRNRLARIKASVKEQTTPVR